MIPHFVDAAPETCSWRGETLACRGEGRAVRALMVLRDLHEADPGFHALALEALPRPCRVGPAQLTMDEEGVLRLDGSPVRLYETAASDDGAGTREGGGASPG